MGRDGGVVVSGTAEGVDCLIFFAEREGAWGDVSALLACGCCC